MPPQTLFDTSKVDFEKVLFDRDSIYSVNPHRFEFMQLNGICHLDKDAGEIAGFRDINEDEFWVKGHIPGRPIFPGVLMMETAAQLVSFYVMSGQPEKGFLGFGGVDEVKFRGAVVPGDRVVMLGKMVEMRRRRCVGATQAYVNDRLVYEGKITGMWL
ncbi:MAG: 3-hydroxyacyl-ACP dehydratase FabZ family protein [Phycisphaerae bacterium]